MGTWPPILSGRVVGPTEQSGGWNGIRDRQHRGVGDIPMRRVVVTGIGIVSPNGIGRRAFSEAIVEGRSGVGRIECFDTSGQAVTIAGEVKGFDVLPYL